MYFDKFIRIDIRSDIGFAFGNRICDRCHIQADGANRIVVARNDVINACWITVGIHHTKHRNTELVRFSDRNMLVLHINNKNCVRQTAHFFNTTQTALQLIHHAGTQQGLFLRQ